ncbi:MAG TPA: cupin domain-containing protein [Stellaceae bacterium]|jgi:quercetin dioxygenase-like cupin family protein|nr:cupin domain-containing protein [Stellaceae bacterium]
MTDPFPPIRRIVTGHDDKGVAKVLWEDFATNAKPSRRPGGGKSTLIWSSDRMPMAMPIGEKIEDEGARILGTAPPPNGTRFCVIDFPANAPGTMHRTETVDYVLVLFGEIDMDMDDSTVHLKAGDILIQRGTNHSWVNRSDKPARVAFVLIDAQPLGIGHPVTGASNPG